MELQLLGCHGHAFHMGTLAPLLSLTLQVCTQVGEKPTHGSAESPAPMRLVPEYCPHAVKAKRLVPEGLVRVQLLVATLLGLDLGIQ